MSKYPYFVCDKYYVLDIAILFYLALPLFFFFFFFKIPIFVFLSCLLALIIFFSTRGRLSIELDIKKTISVLFILTFLIAIIQVVCSGIGHFFYANSDWKLRDSIIHDLSAASWPVIYGNNGAEFILRSPLSAFIIPAALSANNYLFANIFFFIWICIGWFLTLRLGSSLFLKLKEKLIFIFFFSIFGGMDWVGFIITKNRFPDIGEHIEWWAGMHGQLSSVPTLLSWVPHHALPAWLGVFFVLRHWRTPKLAVISPLIFSAVLMWSPFAAIGLLPFILISINWKDDYREFFTYSVLCSPIFLITSSYLTFGSSNIPHGWLYRDFGGFLNFFIWDSKFIFIEFFLLFLAILKIGEYRRLFIFSLTFIIALTFYKYGFWNDLLMRASISATAVLMLACVKPLAKPAFSLPYITILTALIFGALGSLQEPLRTIRSSPWPVADKNYLVASEDVGLNPFDPLYLVKISKDDLLYHLLKEHKVYVEYKNNP